MQQIQQTVSLFHKYRFAFPSNGIIYNTSNLHPTVEFVRCSTFHSPHPNRVMRLLRECMLTFCELRSFVLVSVWVSWLAARGPLGTLLTATTNSSVEKIKNWKMTVEQCPNHAWVTNIRKELSELQILFNIQCAKHQGNTFSITHGGTQRTATLISAHEMFISLLQRNK